MFVDKIGRCAHSHHDFSVRIRAQRLRSFAYRVLNEDGTILTDDPNLDKDCVLEMYATMVRLETMDKVFYDAQRQGRISFYMTSTGEEASTVGSAAALKAQDMIFAQYREAGVLMWRGFTLQNFADQCFSNVGDPCKGRQMPIHYGSKALNYQTISSPLATQIPQASGAAYAVKASGREDECVVAYFGEGAASEGDFHPALNFAATLECPVVFFCRNNGYAISTPLKDQYRGDGIASRAQGYGMASIRVDGNDIFAVYEATQAARNLAISEQRPVLVESMSYRQGHHSTSDDSTRYRDVVEIDEWRSNSHPITRLRSYMESKGWWDDSMEETRREKERSGVLQAMQVAEGKPKPPVLENLFDDVFEANTPEIEEQREHLTAHLARFPDEYKL